MPGAPTGTAEAPCWPGAIHELAALERPSASAGERRAAEWIAARLRELGCRTALEREQAHGGYWWPLGLANATSILGALLALRRGGWRSRALAGALAAAASGALWDDLGHGRRWFRRLLPRRSTWNVIAEAGDPEAKRNLVLVAHHDAAHSGLIFHPAFARIGPALAPRLHERSSHTLPVLYGVWLGPTAICVGALLGARRVLRAGLALATGATAAMVDIGTRGVVPGANDNLAAVGVLVAIAQALREDPVEGLQVLLVSTGSEESFSEGMQAFVERHRDELDPADTEMLCLECLGGPTLIVLEGEGMLRMRDYPVVMREALEEAARAAGVEITRGLRTVAATDALIALRAGYRVVTLASVDHTKFPLNYHWPSDTPEALHWETVRDAIAVCEQFLRRRARGGSLSAAANP